MTCWACGSRTTIFYEQAPVPAGSCVLLRDQAAAIAYPTGSLILAHCAACGLVQNEAFDENLVDYASGYEASQAFSPTFRAFADTLADGLIGRYGLSGATILEPGCGDGSFLRLLVSKTGGCGIGLDPAYNPESAGAEEMEGVEIRRELFTPASGLTADLIVSRHTLEHIRDISTFMDAVRIAAEGTPGSVVVFEVPDALPVIGAGAFWDVYYEHASYFGKISLENLFRRHGLTPEHIWAAFDGQYVIIEARVAGGGDHTDRPDEQMRAAVAGFRVRVQGAVDRWRDRVGAVRRPVVWGASSKAVGFMAAVPGIMAAVDINPNKWGSYLAGSGVPVVGPDDLAAMAPDLVVVMNPIYRDEIRHRLDMLVPAADIAVLG